MTVETPGGDELQPGVQAVFFTQSWIHAEEIAVREVARLGPETAGEVADAVARLPDAHLAERLARCRRCPGDGAGHAARAGASPATARHRSGRGDARRRVDPEGQRRGPAPVLPGRATRIIGIARLFAAGQHGIFLLHSGDPLAEEWLDAVNGRENVVTALDPADVQADSQLDRVRSLLGSGGV